MNIFEKFNKYKKTRKIMKISEIDSKVKQLKYSIIIPYRNNKSNERKEQLGIFIDFAKKTFSNNVKIFIIEQSDDNKGFNRGALLNIGIDLSKNIDYCILHDVDLIPDEELLKYYYTYPNKPIHIARPWKNKYTNFTFFGGILSVNKKLLECSNGFPNNFFGWGKEDDAFYNRVANFVDLFYIPKNGNIKELKHDISHSKLSKEENINKKKLILNDLTNWKNNGLNNLKYKILKKNKITNNITQVLVKLD